MYDNYYLFFFFYPNLLLFSISLLSFKQKHENMNLCGTAKINKNNRKLCFSTLKYLLFFSYFKGSLKKNERKSGLKFYYYVYVAPWKGKSKQNVYYSYSLFILLYMFMFGIKIVQHLISEKGSTQ